MKKASTLLKKIVKTSFDFGRERRILSAAHNIEAVRDAFEPYYQSATKNQVRWSHVHNESFVNSYYRVERHMVDRYGHVVIDLLEYRRKPSVTITPEQKKKERTCPPELCRFVDSSIYQTRKDFLELIP